MKPAPRLYLDQPLEPAAEVELSREQAHYLIDVLRLRRGEEVRVFNGRDGEWDATLATVSKKRVTVRCERQVAQALPPPDIDYLFAPLKHARLDYAVQKATELGVRRLRPVITRRTIAQRLNLERMRANAIEAAEQCNLVFVPEVAEPLPLDEVLKDWEKGRSLVFCDEGAALADPIASLRTITRPAALLIGPEGGFMEDERLALRDLPYVTAISLGPRIMRADTAAVAGLALLQAVIGDWHQRS